MIADRMAAGAVVELQRRRPHHRHRFDIVRLREIEARRNAGIARHAPIGFPAGLDLEGDTAEQDGAAARSREQPHRGMSVTLPRRCVVGMGRKRQR
ncbi:hypothetical protein ACVWWP_007837 [Bradyrhizobium sp. LM3.6]